MSGPAQTYAAVTAAVNALIARAPAENDKSRVAYMVARAALLHVKGVEGARVAAEKAYQLADEFATDGGR